MCHFYEVTFVIGLCNAILKMSSVRDTYYRKTVFHYNSQHSLTAVKESLTSKLTRTSIVMSII